MVSSSECRHTPCPASCGHLGARLAVGGQTAALSAPLLAHACRGCLWPREAHGGLNVALSLSANLTPHTWGTCSPKSCSWIQCQRSALSSRPLMLRTKGQKLCPRVACVQSTRPPRGGHHAGGQTWVGPGCSCERCLLTIGGSEGAPRCCGQSPRVTGSTHREERWPKAGFSGHGCPRAPRAAEASQPPRNCDSYLGEELSAAGEDPSQMTVPSVG